MKQDIQDFKKARQEKTFKEEENKIAGKLIILAVFIVVLTLLFTFTTTDGGALDIFYDIRILVS